MNCSINIFFYPGYFQRKNCKHCFHFSFRRNEKVKEASEAVGADLKQAADSAKVKAKKAIDSSKVGEKAKNIIAIGAEKVEEGAKKVKESVEK